MTILFPIIYSAALTYLVWKAFKVMSNGWNISGTEKKGINTTNIQQKKIICFLGDHHGNFLPIKCNIPAST